MNTSEGQMALPVAVAVACIVGGLLCEIIARIEVLPVNAHHYSVVVPQWKVTLGLHCEDVILISVLPFDLPLTNGNIPVSV